MRFTRLLLCFAIATLFVVAGCGGAPPPTATPTPEPPPALPRVVPTTAATVSPTAVPTATATRAPLPPAVIGIAPDRGEEQVLAAPVTITFDQPMDPASTGAAFSIEPKVPGEVQVKGNQLIFSPTERLQRGAEYRVSLGATASSATGLRLPQPVSFKFKTAGLLQVTSVQPAPGAGGVPVDAALVVGFNRPVVPLGGPVPGTSEVPGTSVPLIITPTVRGAGEWITTSIYRFTPAGGLAASTGYTVTVPAGLEDTTGGLLTEPYTFTFRTTDPTVRRWDFVRASRRDGADNVTPASPISVTFSLPMERASTEAAFRLVEITGQSQPVGGPLAGVFTWNTDGTVMGFKPAKALSLGTRYLASVAATARPANGQGALRAAVSRDFTTVFPPRIVRTLPANSDTRVTPGGGVSFQFASPINPASLVSGTVTILPLPTRVFTTYSEWDNTLYLNVEKLPDTAYTVTLSGKIADPYGNLLGADTVLRFATRQYDSFVQLYSTGPVGTYNAYTPTTAAVTYRNVSHISFGLWNLPDNEFIALAGQGFWDKWRNYAPKPANLRREWQYETSAARNQIGVAVTRLEDREGAALPPGLYYLVVDSETAQIIDQTETPGSQRQLIARTTANVTLKAWADGALAWVTDLKSGQPLAGAEVRFTDGLGVDQRTTTNRDGIAEVTFDRPRQPWVTLLALARTPDGGFGVVSTGWTSGIGPWDFRVNSDSSTDPYSGAVYTDRPIYRPGQTVYWKAIIRRDNDAIYALPAAGQPVTVTINDGEGKTLWNRAVALDGMGAAHGALALDADASLGYYQISVRIPDLKPTKERDGTYVSMGFQVAEYRKPEYEVSAQTGQPEYIQGEQIKTTVQANYFFGQPVKGAAVRWTLLSSDFAFQLPEERPGGPYSFGDWDWYATDRGPNFGGALSQGEGITDAEGRYTFTVPADITKFSGSQRFTFDITILDTNGQTVSTQTAAVVHKGAFYIGLRPQSYVSTANKAVPIDVLTVNPQGKAEAEAKVEVIANRIRWYSVRERAEDGNYYWNSRAEKTPVFTQTVTTGNDGTAIFTFTPDEAGEYKIEATSRDRAGHMIRSATYAWVSEGLNRRAYTAWRQENNDRIQLIPDKKEYQAGETARLLVASPYQTPVKALLTIERGGILTRTVIEIRGNSELLEIPIRPDFAPDVFASVLLVKGIDATSPAPSFKMGLAALKVSVADKQLQVVLTPRVKAEVEVKAEGSGPLRVGPREKMVWEVRTLDAAGKPVQAEVSLALVDKAVLSLVEGPEGNTDTLLSRFYRERGLGVTTAATLVMNVDRLISQLAEGGKGGGGGGDGGGDLTVRREFPDTAYWNAAVRTGANGTARVELTLPDSLTTWTMDARAVTADTKVGQTRTDIIATKELLVRPVLPRFFIAGDQAEIAAIVHNNTKAEAEVEVKIVASGLQIAAATQRKVTIKTGDTAKIVWPVTVAANAEQVTVTMTAGAGTQAAPLRDAVEITLPVYRYTTPETVGSSGQVAVGESRLELVRLPVGADPTAGELVVRLEASLAAGMAGGLTYLEHYPYECTEQTVSRFLPNVVSYQALKKLGRGNPAPTSDDVETKLAQQVGVGLQRLYAGQHVDGGWGWWPRDESDGMVSAYVVLGMAKAKQAGFAVDAAALARGTRYLKEQLAASATRGGGVTPPLQDAALNRQAIILYALAEAGAGEPNRAGALYEQRERLSLDAKGHLVLAFGLMGDGASAARLQTLLADITSRAITSGTATHWEETRPDAWNMSSDTRTTAILLAVLARHAPKHSLAPNAVRWLMTARRADRWETTQENAWAILALTDWLVASGELQGDYAWRALLNGAALGQGQVTPATVGDVMTLRAAVGGKTGGETPPLQADQTNALVIQRAATADQLGKTPAAAGDDRARGQLYYTLQLKSYQPVEKIGPLNRGVIISREYRLAECGKGHEGTAPHAQTACPPITQARVGDVIDVRLRIIAAQQLHYLIVEDPLPAGAEAIDTSLRTASITARGPEVQRVAEKGEDESDWQWWGWWTPTQIELRDEKTALFATELAPGSYEFRYQIRASLPGQFRLLPPTAYQMYQPEVWGRGAGGVFGVGE